MNSSIENKNVLITGATNGIGKAVALKLAKLNYHIIFIAKDKKKAEKTKLEILKNSNNKNINYYLVDLSKQEEIQLFAETFKKNYQTLNILINNAGIQTFRRQSTNKGYEKTFAVNHLAYFMLTGLLLEIIKNSSPSRIINVSSGAHWKGKIHFDDLHMKKGLFNGVAAYEQSKLANIMFTFYLADKLEGTGVIVNAVHPGRVRTDLLKVYGLGKLLWKYNPFNLTPEKGAETIVYLATSREVNGITGKYYAFMKERRTLEDARNKEQQEKLWKISEELTNNKY